MANKNTILLGYGANLIAPFDGMHSHRLPVKSKYTPARAQVNAGAGFINAFLYIFDAMMEKGNRISIAYTRCGDILVEYHSHNVDKVHFIVANADTLEIKGCIHDIGVRHQEAYSLEGGNSKTALIASLLNVYLQDEEFEDNYNAAMTEAKSGYPDVEDAYNYFVIMGENVYRRVSDSSLAESIDIDLSMEKLPLLTAKMLQQDEYHITKVICGDFDEYKKISGMEVSASGKLKIATPQVLLKEFVKKYPLAPNRKWTEEELSIMENNMEDDFLVVPSICDNFCKRIVESTKTNNPQRVYSLRGDAGSGKSTTAKIIAIGLGIPHVIHQFSSDSDKFDVYGGYVPTKSAFSESTPAIIKEFAKEGKVNAKTVAKIFHLPTSADIFFMPDMMYVTMAPDAEVSEQEDGSFICDGKRYSRDEFVGKALALLDEITAEKIQEIVSSKSISGENNFSFIESPLVKAAKYGYSCELQETDTIRDEGVLVLTNSLFEEGQFTLPTGEVVKVHPDAVFCFTNNIGYKGCRAMNNAVMDRWQFGATLNTPTAEEMAEKAIRKSSNNNKKQVLAMAKIIKDIYDAMKDKGIKDGITGQRALNNWATGALFNDVEDEFAESVLFKVSTLEANQYTINEIFLESPYRRDLYAKPEED